jgi:hypothetical protein
MDTVGIVIVIYVVDSIFRIVIYHITITIAGQHANNDIG